MKADTYCHVKHHNHLGTFLNSYFPMSGVTEFELNPLHNFVRHRKQKIKHVKGKKFPL